MLSKTPFVTFGFAFFFSLTSCGGKKESYVAGPSLTLVESSFAKAAAEFNIPVRMMLAAAYIESGIRADKSSATYSMDGQIVSRTPAKGETIFGFSFAELGIEANQSSDLPAQIEAYAKYIRKQIGTENLPNRVVTAEEKIRWIWKLANIHRGENSRRNLVAVFSHEMIQTLSEGFSVQDSEGVIARLEREPVSLKHSDLPENYKQDLQLDMYHADIRSAYLFSLAGNQPTGVENHPKRIEVVHCPFALSSCIQMQETSLIDSAPLGAHYIIPASSAAVPGTVQFNHHNEAVRLLKTDGSVEVVTDRIIIMLAGASGRYIDGVRKYADPLWMTDFQLKLLGAAISEVCQDLNRKEGVNYDSCQSIGVDSGIVFRTQPADVYRWGDIADYDEAIIIPYISKLNGHLGSTSLNLNPDGVQTAGSSFKLSAEFQGITRRIELERLVRCPAPDSRVVWEPVDQRQVRNVSAYSFDNNVWYDAGPNGTGDQFFRIKATGEAGKFLGWSTKRVQLKGFEKNSPEEAPSKYCMRNGT